MLGHSSARGESNGWETAILSSFGLRPAFEFMNPEDYSDVKVGDVVVMGTLYVGDDPVKVPTNPVWNGDITPYDEEQANITTKITLGAALDNADYQMKAVYVGNGVFVCDRVMLNFISWNQINAALS